MYVKRISINNIRSITSLEWSVSEKQAPGWHVILGNNGAGKSTFVRSIALALIGPERGIALRQSWQNWLRHEELDGHIYVNLIQNEEVDEIDPSYSPVIQYSFSETETETNAAHQQAVEWMKDKIYEFPSAMILFQRVKEETLVRMPASPLGWQQPDGKYNPFSFIWSNGKGWFSASYGPFRRFTGGEEEDNQTLWADAKLSRHLTAFEENLVLSKSLSWLRDLQFKKLEGRPDGATLDRIQEFINQEGFLPFGVHLDKVTSDGIEFIDGNGSRISVEELSDGYRSILSLTFELIRQLVIAYGSEKVFSTDKKTVVVPGVVLIDEVDAHLHPTWQQEISVWFMRLFPQIQFLVTTHSPLVCQQATTVLVLPDPGSEDNGRMLEETELNRLRYGDVLEAYSTGAFGDIERSEEGERKLERLAELNRKELQKGLTKREKAEQDRLRSIFATTPNTFHSEAAISK